MKFNQRSGGQNIETKHKTEKNVMKKH